MQVVDAEGYRQYTLYHGNILAFMSADNDYQQKDFVIAIKRLIFAK